jgi:hypothetical protein
MSETVFALLEGELHPLQETPFPLEADLQEVVAEHPELLGGEQMDDSRPRRFALVTREVPIPDRLEGAGRWALDHLFVDQDAVPTLVEVKRASNSQLRREVVGQLLDYAANAVRYWTVTDLASAFEATHADESDLVLARLVGHEIDDAEFWERVSTNLAEGRARLIFLADRIPTELQAIVEFLNERLDPTEVLAVELRQYRTPDGPQVLVPRVIGMTAVAKSVRRSRSSARYADVLEASSPSAQQMEQRLLAWAAEAGIESRPGHKSRKFSTTAGVDLLNFYPAGPGLEFRLETIRDADPALAQDLLLRMSSFTERRLAQKYPTVNTDDIVDTFDRFAADVLAPYVEARVRYSRRGLGDDLALRSQTHDRRGVHGT